MLSFLQSFLLEDDFDVISRSEIRPDEMHVLEAKLTKAKNKTKKRKHVDILRDFLVDLCEDRKTPTLVATLEILFDIHR